MGTFVTGNTSFGADKTDANTPTGATTELDAADINGLRSACIDLRTAIQQLVMENMLPNTQWQIASAIGSGTKWNSSGTAAMNAISVTSYTTGANTVVFSTANTQSIKAGDLVVISGGAHANLKICALRVDSVIANTSFTCSLPRGLLGIASAACTATPTDAGGTASIGTGDGFDGWGKTTTLQCWREDNSINVLAGSKYSAAFLKGSAGAESTWYQAPVRDVGKFQGRNMSIGMYCRQKIKGGSGTWRLFITTDGTGGTTTYGSAATSTTYTWAEVTATIPSDATSIRLGIEFNGAIGDVYYLSQPIAGRGTYIGTGNYRAPQNEILVPKVKISLLSFIGASVAFPNVLDASGVTYGFAVRTSEAESPGSIAPTVKMLSAQIEARSAGPLGVAAGVNGVCIAIRDQEPNPLKFAILKYCTAADQLVTGEGYITLNDTGDCWMYSNVAGGSYTDTASNWYQISIDINGYIL